MTKKEIQVIFKGIYFIQMLWKLQQYMYISCQDKTTSFEKNHCG